jgi:hypothetical protein
MTSRNFWRLIVTGGIVWLAVVGIAVFFLLKFVARHA